MHWRKKADRVQAFMKHGVLIFLLLTSLACGAQSKFGIKIYQNSDFYKSSLALDGDPDPAQNKTQTNRFSLALTKSSRKNFFHELEFFMPDLNAKSQNVQFPTRYQLYHDQNDLQYRTTTLSFRYEVNKNIFSSGNFSINLGAGLNPYYIYNYDRLLTPNAYFYTYHVRVYGASLNLIPGLKYAISVHWSVDVNIPVKVLDWETKAFTINNPSIPYRQQTNTTNHYYVFAPVYNIRAGLQYIL